MFGRVFLTQIKQALRTKKYIIWTAFFPICLGTLFAFAFRTIYSSEQIHTIPVAIIVEDSAKEDNPFVKLTSELEYEDGSKMLDRVSVSDMEEAEQLLRDGEINGIITVSDEDDISLEIRDNGTEESILTSVIKTYRRQMDLVKDVLEKNPEAAADMEGLLEKLLSNKEFVEASGMAGDNKDPFVAYFYNLIAMISLMGSMASLSVVVHTQANQSSEGLRVDVSPVNKVVYELSMFLAVTITQIVIIFLALSYYMFILKIRFGGDLGMIYLTSAIASFLGTSLGFMVGHIGTAKEDFKETILMVITVGGGFMSGLMAPDIKADMEEKFPLFNRVNPSSVLTDAFYSLNVYGVGERYYRTMAVVVAMTLVFMAVGIAFSRRKQYASL